MILDKMIKRLNIPETRKAQNATSFILDGVKDRAGDMNEEVPDQPISLS